MYKPINLPPKEDLETKAILKKLLPAHKALAELKGKAETMPNQIILLNTISLQEAKDSSEVENIMTTHDELYKAELQIEGIQSIAAKEVQNYVAALKKGCELVKEHGLLTNNDITTIQQIIEKNKAGFRKIPGSSLKDGDGKIVYEPPQDNATIQSLMTNLESFINNDDMSDLDDITKMAIIHFQFESIHPFYDGNGRTGRIMNILYLIKMDLLNLPILYLSRYVIQNKSKYYQYIQDVRDSGNWESWLLFMIDAVEQTANQTMQIIYEVKELMMEYKHGIRGKYKFYSQDLLNNLFKHPYTKIDFVQNDLGVSRITAASYLNTLAKDGYLNKHKYGKNNYYINNRLVNIFMSQHPLNSKI